MNNFGECLASIRLVFTSETTCKLCFITAPIVWIFGSFLLGVKAITIYAKFEGSTTTIFLIVFGLFMMLCGIFSASNTIHICIQQPTSQIALKIQKSGQMIVVGLFVILLILGWVLRDPGSTEIVAEDLNEYDNLLWQMLTFLGLFAVTTLSCLYTEPWPN